MDATIHAYLAGVIDSDGCIAVKRSNYGARHGRMVSASYQARITVRQVEPQAVALLHSTLAGSRSTTRSYSKRGRTLHAWDVHSAAAGRALTVLLPHLRIKREQAINALEVCRLATTRSKAFVVPEVIEGESMVTMAEAARRLEKSYAVVYQAVRKAGSVPHVRTGSREVLIPESFLAVWAERPRSPARAPAVTAALEACYQRAKELNRVGVR